MAVNENLFPDLVRTGYQITSPPDSIYNCIAHAANIKTAWWWPDPDGFDFWTSKLGPDDDIEHELEGLCSPAYGVVVQFLRRLLPQS